MAGGKSCRSASRNGTQTKHRETSNQAISMHFGLCRNRKSEPIDTAHRTQKHACTTAIPGSVPASRRLFAAASEPSAAACTDQIRQAATAIKTQSHSEVSQAKSKTQTRGNISQSWNRASRRQSATDNSASRSDMASNRRTAEKRSMQIEGWDE